MAERGQGRLRSPAGRGPFRGRTVAGRPGRHGGRGLTEGSSIQKRIPDGPLVVLWDEAPSPGADDGLPPVSRD